MLPKGSLPIEAAQFSAEAAASAADEEKIQQLEEHLVTLDVRNHYLEVSVKLI